MTNNKIFRMSTTIISCCALLLTSCERSELDRGPNTPEDPAVIATKARCPKATVLYTDLAVIAGPPTPATGQLNLVYQRCFPVPACGSFTNYSSEVLTGCVQLGSVELPISSMPYVTYAEQVATISYLKDLAQLNAPICSGTVKKVIKSMKFYRDAFIPNGICAYVVYACCGSEQG
jgi:hypothetical protein